MTKAEFMREFPQPPTGTGTCEQCRHWFEPMKSQVAFTPQGPVPMDAIRASGQIHAGPRGIVAPCTAGPQWHSTPANWWCGQWKGVIGT